MLFLRTSSAAIVLCRVSRTCVLLPNARRLSSKETQQAIAKELAAMEKRASLQASNSLKRKRKPTDPKVLYSNFGHQRPRDSKTQIICLFSLGCAVIYYMFFNGPDEVKDWVDSKTSSKAKEVEGEQPQVVEQPEGEEEEGDKKKKKKKVGFRDRKIIAYEDRIRAYSTPDKIFRYFATLQEQDSGEIYMTPEDFVRSLTPGMKQPEGLGLDQFKKFDIKKDSVARNVSQDSVFNALGEHALVAFNDYIFLLTLLSAPQKQFELAFKMFDLNGDGELDFGEFEKVQGVIRAQTSVGQRHRDTGDSVIKHTNTALACYFFGPKCDGKLTVEEFLKFQGKLQMEVMRLEFEKCEPEDGKITERDFAMSLIMYAGMSDVRRTKMLKRIKKKFKGEASQGITFEDYVKFYHFLKNIGDVDTALTFYHIAGASIDQETLKHVAKTVAGVDLGDHIVETVFTLFDENEDGELSNKEFVSVMKQRMMRGLEKPKDTGFFKLLNAVYKCAKHQSTHIFE
ncbi:calcium uptake protein 1, mitochondrial isoform X2 [Lingula anatina]|uniref:Calcium uptake protein 1, mitochondrial isoform X2 n=1 Tax=Lingula anatina TaxID=7574 RepID=A0A1S3JJ26_LINAN|nr:calcium uptake protein 1, mitochondrial isoform X2 [Lingula anatina]|eukprot:XP_013410415.1 calcium uptake protein 1, mitochondrial isoform X2 [Lingula anatina]